MSDYKLEVQSLFRKYNIQIIKNFENYLINYNLEKTIFIIDSKVDELYKNKIDLSLISTRILKIDASEDAKSMKNSIFFIDKLIDLNVKRNDTIVAIGGGVVQDIAAFIASILFRGINWHFYPTTLLAQADSCIGSKSSINFRKYKNLIGTFCPPSKIFTDLQFLNTLTKQEIKSGIGEILHYYFTDGIDLAKQLSNDYELLLKNTSKLTFYIFKSLEIKKKIIELDEFDTKIRHIFNYGHTFGHAIESITNYKIPHGQAITIGMDLANFISLKLGMLEQDLFSEMHTILEKNMPVFIFDENNIGDYLLALAKDKKNIGNQLGCILTRGPGKMEKKFINIDEELKILILTYSDIYLKKIII